MDIYQKVVFAAEQAIKALANESKRTGNILHDWVKHHKANFDFDIDELALSWGVYLTRACSDPNTNISREAGRYNYVLVDKKAAIKIDAEEQETYNNNTIEASIDIEEDKKSKKAYAQREAKLYELLAEWFQSAGYKAEDTSSTRVGGIWGNPDITGLMIIDNPLGGQSIEIGTIEAKISTTNWRKEFFEAVSHKRFSHRAYFAFAVGAEKPSIDYIDNYIDVRKYAEKYKVGVIVVFMEPEKYKTLIHGNISTLDLRIDEVVVTEIWPATYDYVTAADVTMFIKEVLKLSSPSQIQDFGRK
jgi:hypothetical protein